MVSLTVVIATCGRPERLARCLDAVQVALRTWGGEGEIVVVDNHPRYEAEGVVRDHGQRTTYYRLQTTDHGPRTTDNGQRTMDHGTAKESSVCSPLSVVCCPLRYLRSEPFNKAKALNAGIAAAQGEWLAFTDDDCLPDPQWIARAVVFLEQQREVRAFGGRIVPGPVEGKLPRWLVPGWSGRVPSVGVFALYEPLKQSGMLGPSDTVPFGANFFAHRTVFDKHGGYDAELWTLCGSKALGAEDAEFGMRIRAGGEMIGYCREALVVHPVRLDRAGIWAHLQIGYTYGWREPLLFFDPSRPLCEWFRARVILNCAGRVVGDMVRGDVAGVVDDAVHIAHQFGAVGGRWSRPYRRMCARKRKARSSMK